MKAEVKPEKAQSNQTKLEWKATNKTHTEQATETATATALSSSSSIASSTSGSIGEEDEEEDSLKVLPLVRLCSLCSFFFALNFSFSSFFFFLS